MSRIKHLQSSLASLRLHGPDQKGIVAACSHTLDKFGCGIVQSETWTDRLEHLFFQRILFDYDHNHRGYFVKDGMNDNNNNVIHPEITMAIDYEMERLKDRFGLHSMNVNWRTKSKKIVLFVSKYDHCLVSFFIGFPEVVIIIIITTMMIHVFIHFLVVILILKLYSYFAIIFI